MKQLIMFIIHTRFLFIQIFRPMPELKVNRQKIYVICAWSKITNNSLELYIKEVLATFNIACINSMPDSGIESAYPLPRRENAVCSYGPSVKQLRSG